MRTYMQYGEVFSDKLSGASSKVEPDHASSPERNTFYIAHPPDPERTVSLTLI